MADGAFRDRLLRAWTLLHARRGRNLSQVWLAQEVGRELGQDGPVGQSTISGYFTGRFQPEDVDRWLALAKVLEVDPGWLAFGDASNASPPPNPFPTAGPEKL